MKYNRILLKLSGESLMGSQSYGISPEMLEQYVKDIKTVVEKKVQVSIVIGGGNIFRGLSGAAKGMDRVQGDYMGMLATLINSMALQAELEKQGVKTELLSGLAIEPICKEMSRRRAIEAMEDGRVVIIGGGSGNPFFYYRHCICTARCGDKSRCDTQGYPCRRCVYCRSRERPHCYQIHNAVVSRSAYKETQNHGSYSLCPL